MFEKRTYTMMKIGKVVGGGHTDTGYHRVAIELG